MINVFLWLFVPLVILIISFVSFTSWGPPSIMKHIAAIWFVVAVIYLITTIVRRVLAVEENKRKRSKALASAIINLVTSFIVFFILLVTSTFGIGVGGTLDGGSLPSAGIGGGGMIAQTSSSSRNGFSSGRQNRYKTNEQRASIDDSREFMKVTYDADVHTRNVEDRADDVEDIIDDNDGRIDQKNVRNDYAYFAFAISKHDYDDLRDDLKDTIPEKFLEEREVEINKLPEKQALEREYDQLSQELDEIRDRRQRQAMEKSEVSAQLIGIYNELENELNMVYAEIEATPEDEEEVLTWLVLQAIAIESLMFDITSARYDTASAYDNKIVALQREIEGYKERLEDNQQRETELISDVRTVDATITIRQISVWKAFERRSPIPVGIWIALLGVIVFGVGIASKPQLPRIEIE